MGSAWGLRLGRMLVPGLRQVYQGQGGVAAEAEAARRLLSRPRLQPELEPHECRLSKLLPPLRQLLRPPLPGRLVKLLPCLYDDHTRRQRG